MPTPPSALQSETTRHSQEHASNNRISQERRRIQNRKNQRAHRKLVLSPPPSSQVHGISGARLRQRDPNYAPKPASFQTRRFRLDEFNEEDVEASSSSALPAASSTSNAGIYALPSVESPRGVANQPPFYFPLSTDHLLHLIRYNVFRGLLSNLNTLQCLLTGWTNLSTATELSIYLASGPYRRETSVYPINPNIPTSLAPTSLQQIRDHSAWISFFPFARMRDNLIQREGTFDHHELLIDLMGEMLNTTPSPRQNEFLGFESPSHTSPQQAPLPASHDDDEITSNRKGLIVWGEPHDVHNWEATPGFLAKWSWVVYGCDEIVASSNRWRAMRGEEPLSILPTVPLPSAGKDL